jgi:NADP-dependent 3-hydroxy acid dehydrogenase YdfG
MCEILWNNAGVEGRIAPLSDVDDATVQQLIDTNIEGV